MNKIKFSHIILFIYCLTISCSKEDNYSKSKYGIEVFDNYTHKEGLQSVSFQSDNNTFILGYFNYVNNTTEYEIRDKDFNILRSEILDGYQYKSPSNSIASINDKVVFGTNGRRIYKSKENFLISVYEDKLSIFNSENMNTTPIFFNDFADDLHRFCETEDFFVFSAYRETCYFLNKTNYNIISFKNRFIKNYDSFGGSGGGSGVGTDDLGRVILSTTEGVLVYENNEWVPFLDGALDRYQSRYVSFFRDSQNRLFASSYFEIIVYDLNSNKLILKIGRTDTVNFSLSRILGEHPDGSILFVINNKYSKPTNRIVKVRIKKN